MKRIKILQNVTIVLLIGLVTLPFPAHSYTCGELAADNAKKVKNRETLGGFESIDEKLTFIMNSTLEDLTVGISKKIFDDLISRGASTDSAYYQSINVGFRVVLQTEMKTKEIINKASKDSGGISRLITTLCQINNNNTNTIIEDLFRPVYIRTMKEGQK